VVGVGASLADRMFAWGNGALVCALMLIVLYPLLYLLSASVSDPAAVASGEMWLWPVGFTLEGFREVLGHRGLLIGYRNTLFYTVAGTLLNLFVTLPCAYALSRPELPGRRAVFVLLLVTLLFHGGMLPTYLLVRDLGLFNTVWALLLPRAASAWHILVATTFFRATISRDLQGAAELDGASPWRFFLAVVLPLSKPLVAVLALFYAVGHWNSYFDALLYLSDRDLYPLQLVLRELLVQQGGASAMLDPSAAAALAERARAAEIIKYAAIVVASAPLLVLFPFVQRFFVQGTLLGSVKDG
jgi:putative aldouronate transport system permease protein